MLSLPPRRLDYDDNQNCDEKVSPYQLEHFCTNDILPALMGKKLKFNIT